MKEIYKKCPICERVQGFVLSNEVIKLDEEYSCYYCQNEIKLSKWENSTKNTYLKECENI